MRPEAYLKGFFQWYDTDEYLDHYEANRAALRAKFEDYCSATGEEKKIMDGMLSAHAALSKRVGKQEAQRRHNSFVLRYVAGAGIKEIACHMKVSPSTTCRDIAQVFDDMMVLTFGVAGLVPYDFVNNY